MEIVVRQMGGLGNQLFEYAAGKYYAAKYNAALRIAIDPSKEPGCKEQPLPFQLDAFSVDVPMRRVNVFEQIVCAESVKARRMAPLALRMANAKLWREPAPFQFFPELPYRRLPATVYMRSFWQAAGYVEGVESALRREFQLKDAPQGEDAAVLDAIAASRCPISVHFRGTDYTAQLRLSPAYYTDAWEKAMAEFEDAEFFIFTNDPAAAAKNLPQAGKRRFVLHNNTFTAYQDLRLMAACRHHIIANSTFSWWGAWLNPRPDKVVMAPKFWRNTADSYYPDLFPAAWRLLDNPVDEWR
jgi:hypothetical protein